MTHPHSHSSFPLISLLENRDTDQGPQTHRVTGRSYEERKQQGWHSFLVCAPAATMVGFFRKIHKIFLRKSVCFLRRNQILMNQFLCFDVSCCHNSKKEDTCCVSSGKMRRVNGSFLIQIPIYFSSNLFTIFLSELAYWSQEMVHFCQVVPYLAVL